jgi:two-component system chemotaxis response regulator CheB
VAPPSPSIPQSLQDEVLIALGTESIPVTQRPGTLSPLSCPECSGPLWQSGEDDMRFRCLTGHSFHLRSLLQGADGEIDRSLWAAIRLLEQRGNISNMMQQRERQRGRVRRAALHADQAAEALRYARTLRELQMRRKAPSDDAEAAAPETNSEN